MEELTEKQKMQVRLERVEADLQEALQNNDESLELHIMYLRGSITELTQIIAAYGDS